MAGLLAASGCRGGQRRGWVSGRPNMRMQLALEPGGEKNLNSAIALTGIAAVNAIPYLVEAEPEIYDPIAGRGVVTRQAVGAHRASRAYT